MASRVRVVFARFWILLYIATRGAVYDRYCFACGLPVLLVRHAPGWAVAARCFWLLLTLWSTSNWLLPAA